VVGGKLPDVVPDFGEGIAAVGGEVLRDAEGGEKGRVVREDFRRGLAAVKSRPAMAWTTRESESQAKKHWPSRKAGTNQSLARQPGIRWASVRPSGASAGRVLA